MANIEVLPQIITGLLARTYGLQSRRQGTVSRIERETSRTQNLSRAFWLLVMVSCLYGSLIYLNVSKECSAFVFKDLYTLET
jgi:hypothetical protein